MITVLLFKSDAVNDIVYFTCITYCVILYFSTPPLLLLSSLFSLLLLSPSLFPLLSSPFSLPPLLSSSSSSSSITSSSSSSSSLFPSYLFLLSLFHSFSLIPFKVTSGLDSFVGKTNILLQCYISDIPIETSTLGSDSYFIQQSAGRITRALFEMVLRRGRAFLASKLLEFCKMIDKRQWAHQHPLRQFKQLKPHLLQRLENGKSMCFIKTIILSMYVDVIYYKTISQSISCFCYYGPFSLLMTHVILIYT